MTLGAALNVARQAGSDRAERTIIDRGRDRVRGFDATVPTAARLCDYLLGGKDNYAADRALAERVRREAPIISRLFRLDRAFLHHAAGLLAEQAGIRQFLDVGCGLPARDNVAETVRRIHPASRVAYIDNDPMVLSHARALLAVDEATAAVGADLREPGELLGHPGLRDLIDFAEPVGVLLVGVLHFVSDAEHPRRIIRELLDGLPPGSHIAVSHAERTPELEAVSRLYREAGVAFTPRSRPEITELCRGLELIGPRPAAPLPSRSARPGSAGGALPFIGRIGRIGSRRPVGPLGAVGATGAAGRVQRVGPVDSVGTEAPAMRHRTGVRPEAQVAVISEPY